MLNSSPIPKTYLFYDIETSGLDKCFDQVMQFAAIRCDEALNEIERHEFFVKLNPDTVPTPQAIITHRIGVSQVTDGLTEIEAIQKIHQLLNTPGTISLGYNTLGFDDEFLRFSFYRNLLPPYTHQYENQCCRMDLYPILVLYFLHCNQALTWPNIHNKVSLKLEHINECNQLAPGLAHNAMVDVEATVALARKLKQHEKIWQYACGYFNKQTDAQRIQDLPTAYPHLDLQLKEGLLIAGSLGHRHNYQAPVLSLGPHQHYKNQLLWLRLDDEKIPQITLDNTDDFFIIRKRLGEPPFLLPPYPRYVEKIAAERLEIVHRNKTWLGNNPKKLQILCDYHQHWKYPDVPNLDIDAALYQRSFATTQDLYLLRQFHQVSPDKKWPLAERFPDVLYREQAMRVMMRNYPDYAEEELRNYYWQYLQQACRQGAIYNYRNESHLTLSQALREIPSLQQSGTLDNHQQQLLIELEIWLKKKQYFLELK